MKKCQMVLTHHLKISFQSSLDHLSDKVDKTLSALLMEDLNRQSINKFLISGSMINLV